VQLANSLALGTSPIVRALIDPEGGMRDVRALDNISFTDWFKSHGGSQASIDRMWCALGLVKGGGCAGKPDTHTHTHTHTHRERERERETHTHTHTQRERKRGKSGTLMHTCQGSWTARTSLPAAC
jgi:hypothetical protein